MATMHLLYERLGGQLNANLANSLNRCGFGAIGRQVGSRWRVVHAHLQCQRKELTQALGTRPFAAENNQP